MDTYRFWPSPPPNDFSFLSYILTLTKQSIPQFYVTNQKNNPVHVYLNDQVIFQKR